MTKTDRLEELLTLWLNDEPFKQEGLFFSPRHMAKAILLEMDNMDYFKEGVLQ